MRTAAQHIYATGDVTGMAMIADKAMSHDRIAGRHAAGASVDPYRPGTIVDAVYAAPQIAQVGLTEERAQERGGTVRVLQRGYEALLKAVLLDETEDLVQVAVDAEDGSPLGTSAIGALARDVLTSLALGLRLRVRLEDLAALFLGHPGSSELGFATVRVRANGRPLR